MGDGSPARRPDSLWLRLKAWLVWFLSRIVHATLRIRVVGKENIEMHRGSGPLVYAFWHGRQFLLFGAIPERPLVVLSSLSYDGRMQARICRRFGLEVVFGSSSRGGLKGMLALYRSVRRGKSVAIAVDGPRGPCFKVKAGALAIAAATGRPVVPVASAARRMIVLASAWDRFQIPIPFTRAVVVFGEPLGVDATDRNGLDKAASLLESRLEQLCSKADRLVGRRGG